MAQAEDCASVLDQFVQDAANLPAEIHHLMEEIQAKDKEIQEHRSAIAKRDNSLQKFIKQHGSLAPHPNEEQYNKFIMAYLERCEKLQDEKIALADKVCNLVARHTKRLDVKIRELQNDGALPSDAALPSSFSNAMRSETSFFGNFEAYASETPPLQVSSGNIPHQVSAVRRPAEIPAPLAARPSTVATAAIANAVPRNSAPASPAAHHHLQQRHRESSAGAVDAKRRRLTSGLGALPAASSNLRQSSLGPGTPKVGTPGSTRAGSAGPRAPLPKKATKLAPHQQVRRLKAGKPTKRAGHRHKGTGNKASPSSGGDEDSVVSEAEPSDSENASQNTGRHESAEDEDMDDMKYCTCRSVSYGDMVACDNDSCPYEWFHWSCVGLTKEPAGKWYCPECRPKIS